MYIYVSIIKIKKVMLKMSGEWVFHQGCSELNKFLLECISELKPKNLIANFFDNSDVLLSEWFDADDCSHY